MSFLCKNASKIFNISFNNFFPAILLLFGLFGLFGALFIQYYFGVPPCILCYVQRYFWYFTYAVAFITLFVPSRTVKTCLNIVNFVAVMINFVIALFHAGLQKKYWTAEWLSCGVTNEPQPSFAEMQKMLQSGNIKVGYSPSCDLESFNILGINLPMMNVLLIIVIMVTIYLWIFCERNYASCVDSKE